MSRTNESSWRNLVLALVAILAVPAMGAARGRGYDEHEARAEAARQRELAVALMKRQAAEYEFRGVVPRMVKRFEQSGPYRDAVLARLEAQVAYDAVRAQVLAEVRETPAWQRASDALQRTLADRDAGRNGLHDGYVAAVRILEARTAVTRVEAAALAASPAVGSARERLVAAGTQVRDLTADFDASIRDSVEWKLAHAAMTEAQATVVKLRAGTGGSHGGGSHASAGGSHTQGSGYDQYRSSTYEEAISFCSGCKKRVPDSTKVGDQCPHCGGVFGRDDRTRNRR